MPRPRVTRKEFDGLSRRVDALDRKLDDLVSMVTATYRRGGLRPIRGETKELTDWDFALDLIALRVSCYSFYAWFRDTRLHSDDGSTVSIEAPDAMTAKWLRSHYREVIEESFAGIGRSGSAVRIVVADGVDRRSS